MFFAIDDNLLSQLKAIAASHPTGTCTNTTIIDALTATEADPIVTCLMWTKSDLLAASRKLIQGDNARNADGSYFDCREPFGDASREQIAQEIAGDPDEFVLGMRDEIDNEIERRVIEVVWDAVEDSGNEFGSRSDSYDPLPGDYVITERLPRLPDAVFAEGLAACAREIAERAVRELAR